MRKISEEAIALFAQGKKRCSTCKTIKSHEDFHKDKSKKDGLKHYCAECACEYQKNRFEKSKQTKKPKTIDFASGQVVINNYKKCVSPLHKGDRVMDLSNFGKRKDGCGYQSWCKQCTIERNKKTITVDKNTNVKKEDKTSMNIFTIIKNFILYVLSYKGGKK
jgi:hypothetical protein